MFLKCIRVDMETYGSSVFTCVVILAMIENWSRGSFINSFCMKGHKAPSKTQGRSHYLPVAFVLFFKAIRGVPLSLRCQNSVEEPCPADDRAPCPPSLSEVLELVKPVSIERRLFPPSLSEASRTKSVQLSQIPVYVSFTALAYCALELH